MAYRLHVHDPIGPGLAKVAQRQLDIVERCGQGTPDGAHIHNARKALKRLRALSSLLRGGALDRTARNINRGARELGRLLGSQRDLDVLPATLAKVETRFGLEPKGLTGPLHHAIARASASAAGDKITAELASMLAGLREKTDIVAGAELSIRSLANRCGATLKRARRQLRAAAEKPDSTNVHDLRKSIQRHWRQMALLSPAWPEHYGLRVALAKDLSRLLGEHHDLAVLLQFIKRQKDSTLAKADRAALASLVRARQEEIWEVSAPLVRRLLVEHPKSFAVGLRRNWKLAQRIAAPPLAEAKEISKATDQSAGIVRLAANSRPAGDKKSAELGENAQSTRAKPA